MARLTQAPAALDTRGASFDALLPFTQPADELEWLRSEQLLDEAPACPGERLLAQSLTETATWWRAADLGVAARALIAALPPDVAGTAVIRACAVIAQAAAGLPAAMPVRLACG